MPSNRPLTAEGLKEVQMHDARIPIKRVSNSINVSMFFKSNSNAIVSLGWSRKSIVHFNNFTSGREYNIALGANQVNDIDARFNFWGSSSDENIKEMLHDGTDENGLGTILFIPAEKNMIKLEDIRG